MVRPYGTTSKPCGLTPCEATRYILTRHAAGPSISSLPRFSRLAWPYGAQGVGWIERGFIGMERNTVGTLKVPAAGLSVEVGTREKSVQLAVTRFGMSSRVDLTMVEADALATLLSVAYFDAFNAAPAGVVR